MVIALNWRASRWRSRVSAAKKGASTKKPPSSFERLCHACDRVLTAKAFLLPPAMTAAALAAAVGRPLAFVAVFPLAIGTEWYFRNGRLNLELSQPGPEVALALLYLGLAGFSPGVAHWVSPERL